MITVTLTKWGNSMGVRIPANLVKEAHLSIGETFKVITNKKGGISLIPISNPQAGWTEAFNAIADMEDEKLLIDLPNQFDEDEWTW